VIKTQSDIYCISANTKAVTQTRLQETQLVDEYGGAVYKFCRSITHTKDDADDLFQDTFLKVLSQMPKVAEADDRQGFLLSTAAYLWKSKRRKHARHNRLAPENEINEAADTCIVTVSMEDIVMMKDEQRIVRSLVEALPEKLKLPIILYYTNGLSVAEISITLNIPEGTVKSRLHKARAIIEKGLVTDYDY
jgi:RNA polymerase sigma-70 factor (ECF subfamily)